MKNDDKPTQQMNIMSIFDAKEIDSPQDGEELEPKLPEPLSDCSSDDRAHLQKASVLTMADLVAQGDCSASNLADAMDELPNEHTNETRLDFESALAELERIVTELDSEVKLERALELFDQGIKLSGECERFLKAAEQKVQILKRTSEGVIMVETYKDSAFDGSES
jgi:exodeoxyribonuclease VII small subunit